MKIKTKALGEIDIEERQRIVFPEGLFGFEKFRDYALLDAEQKPFLYLQSLDESGLAFILIDPFLFRQDYSIDVTEASLSPIKAESPADVLVFAIVTASGDGAPITANLMGPLLINKTRRLGMQVVLSDQRWRLKHDIVGEMAEQNRG